MPDILIWGCPIKGRDKNIIMFVSFYFPPPPHAWPYIWILQIYSEIVISKFLIQYCIHWHFCHMWYFIKTFNTHILILKFKFLYFGYMFRY
jgi:hypothetical protein